MIYDLTTLALLPNRLGAVMPKLADVYANFSSTGTPLGCFSIEFGALNRFHFLTEYENTDALQAERARCLEHDDPYGLSEHLGGIERTAFKPLSFARPLKPGTYGPFYEFRIYTIAPGGLPETEQAWAKGIPLREELSPLLSIMGSVEGAPKKMMHIWPYASLDARAAARAEGSKRGIWPPAGGSAHLTSLQSELAVAAACSDLK
ncbi:NIPSNAP family protein [Pseudooceanicola sediminis]|uniref:NIPSNAP family protein n=1 Tax=Pseudooceanicola sediminis TaxID=2211117 RepID=A0A399JAA1_9RHOB|nr:NIPSNAP family protein [Pseudooceanicola sediminis]KAA2317222.1 NIPSNAP family protein [Puniceibacterium sp. HSS470]RII39576.1 NIPSNAP family protein [Pseudooceanicola sediminis]|tara:strand:- start:30606 stop:31220 length:615 start_codon:yes stop_codon:yes gene_type:complete